MFTVKKLFALMLLITVSLACYYFIGYRRFFLSDRTGEKYITIWTSSNNRCYVIPGKYYSPFKPSEDYIETLNHRNYFGIVWASDDSEKINLSIYNQYQIFGLDEGFKIYEDNETMLSNYGITRKINSSQGEEESKLLSDSIKREINYEYIDLNRFYGIKVFSW
ncbi:MAG: hypothetical protein R8G66_25430 [Cytophagales bacterium]|nr:hypothetical protein [Cytophagales bacterium]